MKRIILSAIGILAAVMTAAPTSADDFYKNKTIEFIVVFAPSGNYDSYTRLVARYIGKHIPGNPSTIVKNMPGAGGVVGANHLYNIAARDGSVMGMVNENAPLGQLFETKGILYDARKFTWIGRVVSNSSVFITWHASKVKTADDLFSKEVISGAGGPTSNSRLVPRMLNDLLGTRFKLITGYKSQGDVTLAMQNGEIDGGTRPWTVIKTSHADWVRDKKINLVVLYGLERQHEIPDVPTVIDLAKTTEQRQMLSVVLSGGEIGRTIMAPPGIPTERAATLRKAFDAMMEDPELISYAEKTKTDLEPLSGLKMAEIIQGFFDVPPEIIKRTGVLMGSERE